MGALFAVLTLIAFIWCIVLGLRLQNSAVEFLPPQFQDYLSSRYALSQFALSHPMPLSLQAEYIKLIGVSCVAILCGTLTLFSFHQTVFGFLGIAALLASLFSMIKSVRIYKRNCNAAMAQGDEHEQ